MTIAKPKTKNPKIKKVKNKSFQHSLTILMTLYHDSSSL